MAAKKGSKLLSKKKSKKKRQSRSPARPKITERKGGVAPREKPKEIAVFDPQHVESVLELMPEDDVLQEASGRLQALAHPSRLKALIALSVSDLCVGDIAAIVGLSLSATSTLLKQLRSVGFLTTRSAGKQIYYQINSDIPESILEVIFSSSKIR